MAASDCRDWAALYVTSFLFGLVLLGLRHGHKGSTRIRQSDYMQLKVAKDAKQQRNDGTFWIECSRSKSSCKWEKSEAQRPLPADQRLSPSPQSLRCCTPGQSLDLVAPEAPIGRPESLGGAFSPNNAPFGTRLS